MTYQLGLEWTNTTETGGFYDYFGNWVTLTNSYVAWLTDYTRNLTENYNFKKVNELIPEEEQLDVTLPWKNVNKLKHVKFETGDFMLVYEIWNFTDYQYTAYRVLDPYAATLVNETKICYPIRLHRTESLTLNEDQTVTILESNGDYINMFTISPSFDPNFKEDDGAQRMSVIL